jgi:uncharacterized protein (UPF0335 family)
MADDIKSLIKRIEALEKANQTASATLKKVFLDEQRLGLMAQQIAALQKDGVALDNRVKSLESKK